MTAPLAGRDVFVLGAVDATARTLAVALARAGATISVTTATGNPSEEFFANSILNEAWSMGRAGAAFSADAAHLEELRSAIQLRENAVLVVMPPVADQAWPAELAQDTSQTLILVNGDGDAFELAERGGRRLKATTPTLAEAIAELSPARG